MKEVCCYECGKPIKSVDDLMVVGVHFSLVSLCSGCFVEWHKKPWWFILYHDWSPINHGFGERFALGLILPFIGTLILSLIFVSQAKEYGEVPSWVYLLIWSPLLVILLWGLSIRYVSWVRYEKPLLDRESGEDAP